MLVHEDRGICSLWSSDSASALMVPSQPSHLQLSVWQHLERLSATLLSDLWPKTSVASSQQLCLLRIHGRAFSNCILSSFTSWVSARLGVPLTCVPAYSWTVSYIQRTSQKWMSDIIPIWFWGFFKKETEAHHSALKLRQCSNVMIKVGLR